jgi:MFS family permease
LKRCSLADSRSEVGRQIGLAADAVHHHSPFLPAFIQSHGIPPEQIGLIFAAGRPSGCCRRLVAGRLADRLTARREILAICAIDAAIGGAASASGVWAILLVSLLQAIALAPLALLSDALALLAANRTRNALQPGFEYGWVRGTGPAAFIAGSILLGSAVSSRGLAIILWLQAALVMMVPLAARLVPEESNRFPSQQAITKDSVAALLRMPVFRRVVLVAALILGSHAMHVAEHVPQQLAATAQAYSTVGIGLATAALTLISGWLYARMRPEAFGVMSLLCLAALPLTAGLRRRRCATTRRASRPRHHVLKRRKGRHTPAIGRSLAAMRGRRALSNWRASTERPDRNRQRTSVYSMRSRCARLPPTRSWT